MQEQNGIKDKFKPFLCIFSDASPLTKVLPMAHFVGRNWRWCDTGQSPATFSASLVTVFMLRAVPFPAAVFFGSRSPQTIVIMNINLPPT